MGILPGKNSKETCREGALMKIEKLRKLLNHPLGFLVFQALVLLWLFWDTITTSNLF